MSLTVSAVEKTDREAWEGLYRQYGAFYEVSMTEQLLDTVWGWIFDDAEAFYCLVAKDSSGIALGLMHCREMASPLDAAKVGFLDDLYVAEAWRGLGVVDALFKALDDFAEAQGWPYVQWITGENNYRARAVYDKISDKTPWVMYQKNSAK